MDFTYDDEQTALREAVRGLLAKTYGEFENRRRIVADEPGHDTRLWAQLAEMGILGLPFCEDDGGVGAGPIEIAIVCQELGRVLAPEPYLSSIVHAGGLVAAAGTAEQRADLLGRLSAGEILLAHAVGEQAQVAGEGWAVSGLDPAVPFGAEATHLIVSAGLPDGGVGLFIVDGEATERAGHQTYDGTRAARVSMSAAPAVPLGEAGRDLSQTIATIEDITRIMGANEALGIMQSQVRATCGYLTTRKQFGVTLNTFQALNFRAADMYVSLELTHSLVDWATMTVASASPEQIADAADRVGLQVSRAGRHIGQEAIQLHGGIAMTAEYPVGVGTARLTALEQSLGSGQHHLSRLSDRLGDHGRVNALG